MEEEEEAEGKAVVYMAPVVKGTNVMMSPDTIPLSPTVVVLSSGEQYNIACRVATMATFTCDDTTPPPPVVVVVVVPLVR
jgi:hypothetical protein